MKRFSILVLILVLITSGIVITAQEDTGDISQEVALVYIQEATNGSLVSNGDETYTLTLEGIDEEISYLQSMPALDTGFASSIALFTGWAVAEELPANETILRIDGGSITLVLGTPVYNPVDNMIRYTVTITGMDFGVDNDNQSMAVPDSFEDATLFILMDNEFATALLTGFDSAGLRIGGETCAVCGVCKC